MDDGVEAGGTEETVECCDVMQVDDVEAALGDIVGVAFGEVVQHLDIVSGGEEVMGGVRADVSGSPSDEYFHCFSNDSVELRSLQASRLRACGMPE